MPMMLMIADEEEEEEKEEKRRKKTQHLRRTRGWRPLGEGITWLEKPSVQKALAFSKEQLQLAEGSFRDKAGPPQMATFFYN